MRFRSLLAGLAAPAAALACAAPARAVETGVNETLGQTVPTAEKAPRLGADWVRLWALWQDLSRRAARTPSHLSTSSNAPVAALEGARDQGARGGASRAGVGVRRSAAASRRRRTRRRSRAFMRELAQRVPGATRGSCGTSPTARSSGSAAPQPGAYAALLQAAYPAIKAVQPDDVVVTGGTIGNNMDFVAALYDHGAQGSFDAVGVHTDTACLTNGPDVYYRDERGRVGRYTFSAYREVHAVMSDHGDGAKPIWMTEIGWNTAVARPALVQRRRAGRARSRSACRRSARRASCAPPTAASPPTRSSGLAFWFGMQDIRGRGTPAATASTASTARRKPAAKAFRRARPRHPRRGTAAAAPSIARRRPSACPSRADGQRFAGKLSVRVRAFDNRGGTGIGSGSTLAADGAHVRTWGGSGGSIDPWWATEKWKPGPHTLTFRVRDNAHNESTVTVTRPQALKHTAAVGRSPGSHALPPPHPPARPGRRLLRDRRPGRRGRDRRQRDARRRPSPAPSARPSWAPTGCGVWALWQDLEQPQGVYTEHLIADSRAAGGGVQGARDEGAGGGASGAGVGDGAAQPDRAAGERATFAAFMRTLAQRLPAVDAWELWNEQDGAEFWLGGPDPGGVCGAVEGDLSGDQVRPAGRHVVTGGTVGNDMDFIEALYAHGAKGSFDAVGVHTDTACLVDGPDFNYRDERGRIGRYTFSAFREVHAVMSAPRRRRQADLDDRAGLEHAVDGARLVQRRHVGGPEAARRHRGPAGRVPHGRPTAAWRRTRSSASRFWFGMQDIPGSKFADGYGLYRADGSAEAVRRGLPRARRRDRARSRAAASSTRAARGSQVAQPLDGLKFVDMIDVDAKAVDSGGGVGIRAHRVLRRRQVRALVRRRRRRDLAVVGLALLEARQAHPRRSRRGRGRQQGDEDDHRPQGRAGSRRSRRRPRSRSSSSRPAR